MRDFCSHQHYSLYMYVYVIYLGLPLSRSVVVMRFFIGADDDDVQDLRFNWFHLSAKMQAGKPSLLL